MTELVSTPVHDWHPALYKSHVGWVYSDEYTKPLFDLLSAQPGERIVDLGCGTGELAQRLQDLVGTAGLILGIDASESMLKTAKENGLQNLFRCDIQNLVIPEEFKGLAGTFDAVFTNATLHWCKEDPSGPVRAAKTLLKPGGRFVGEFCGHMNGMGLRSALAQVLRSRGKSPVDAWFLPQAVEYAKILESEGFKVEHISLNPHVSPLPETLVGFLRALYRISYLKNLNDEEAEEVIQEVSRICEFDHKDGMGTWTTMYSSIRFQAIAPM